MEGKNIRIWFALRLAMGFTFLWPFLDKLFGLGFSTPAEKAWLNGASPTAGFLKNGTEGPLAGLFQAIAGSTTVDWLFMLGLLCVGLGLIFGVMLRVASWGGVVMMLLIYASLMPPDNNPVLDEHIVYSLVLISLALGPKMGWWSNTMLVRKYPGLA